MFSLLAQVSLIFSAVQHVSHFVHVPAEEHLYNKMISPRGGLYKSFV